MSKIKLVAIRGIARVSRESEWLFPKCLGMEADFPHHQAALGLPNPAEHVRFE
jgi:hypothetical protein